jgi:hypothetical protein
MNLWIYLGLFIPNFGWTLMFNNILMWLEKFIVCPINMGFLEEVFGFH